MSFVKDLGPTAKMIARKKILGCFQLQKNHFPLASTCTQQTPSTTAFSAAPSPRHPTIMKSACATFELPSSGEFHQNPRNEIHQLDSYAFNAHTGDRSCLDSGFKSTGNKSTAVILNQGKFVNQAQSLVSPSESQLTSLRNLGISSLSSKSCTYKLTPMHLRGDDEIKAAQGPRHEIRSSSQTSQEPRPDQVNPLAQQFTFDLPYLRAQLGKINSSGQDRFLQKGLSAEQNFSDKTIIRETQFVPAMWN